MEAPRRRPHRFWRRVHAGEVGRTDVDWLLRGPAAGGRLLPMDGDKLNPTHSALAAALDAIERDRREPDKVLCHLLAARRELWLLEHPMPPRVEVYPEGSGPYGF
jgi:hypothetical protein